MSLTILAKILQMEPPVFLIKEYADPIVSRLSNMVRGVYPQ